MSARRTLPTKWWAVRCCCRWRRPRRRGAGAPLLKIKDLSALGNRGERAVERLNLTVRAGEIVGIAGVQGNGQDELIECIAGLRSPSRGQVVINGHAAPESPAAARAAGLAYVPADRGGLGLSLESPLWENLMVGHLDKMSDGPFLNPGRAQARAADLLAQYDVRGGGMFATAGSLSGGNQQKVQIARELSRAASVVIVEQPSQGVDIGAIESIHKILVALRDAGKAVLVVSADLDEIMALSDRIAVMYSGQVIADLEASATSYEEIGRYMGGLHQSTAPSETSAAFSPEILDLAL